MQVKAEICKQQSEICKQQSEIKMRHLPAVTDLSVSALECAWQIYFWIDANFFLDQNWARQTFFGSIVWY